MIPPPAFPDTVHVANGCFISALLYLARFTAAFPTERAESAAVMLPNADGNLKPHTLAVVSWHGQWWVRDEYYGVFRLAASSAQPWKPRRLVARAAEELPRLAWRAGDVAERRRQEQAVKELQGESALAWRLAQLEQAKRLLPVPSEIRWCRTAGPDQPFLYFRLQQDDFGVYDPAIGTATARSPERDPDRIVAAVARRMGYREAAESVGREFG